MTRNLLALACTLALATSQFGCDSKKENKAEEVQEQQKDVQEDLREGDSGQDLADEKAELDSAKKDYRDAVQEERRDSLNRQ